MKKNVITYLPNRMAKFALKREVETMWKQIRLFEFTILFHLQSTSAFFNIFYTFDFNFYHLFTGLVCFYIFYGWVPFPLNILRVSKFYLLQLCYINALYVEEKENMRNFVQKITYATILLKLLSKLMLSFQEE